MCLREIEKRYNKRDNKCGYGYKVVYYLRGFMKTKHQGNSNAFKENKWIHERKHRSDYLLKMRYLSVTNWQSTDKYSYGFHVLLTTKKKIEEYMRTKFHFYREFKIVRVKYRNAHVKGIDATYRDFDTIVAKEIFIMPLKKKKK